MGTLCTDGRLELREFWLSFPNSTGPLRLVTLIEGIVPDLVTRLRWTDVELSACLFKTFDGCLKDGEHVIASSAEND